MAKKKALAARMKRTSNERGGWSSSGEKKLSRTEYIETLKGKGGETGIMKIRRDCGTHPVEGIAREGCRVLYIFDFSSA